VVVADRGRARTFVGSAGIVEEVGAPIDADVGKDNFGGFAGYDEHGVRARASETANRMWKMAVQRLLDIHIDRPLDYVAIGGQDETIEEVARLLHPYLAKLPRLRFNTTPGGSSEASIRAELDAADSEIREQRQMALAGRVCDTAWSGGNAVVGLRESLDAANATAIDTLVVAGDFRRSGAMCTACGHLTREAGRCPVCGEALLEVEDVVAALMESAVSAGGRVVQIGVASPLDGDGVGALTRFPVNP
jgi:peptide subunit release factor 1 (eRF1)